MASLRDLVADSTPLPRIDCGFSQRLHFDAAPGGPIHRRLTSEIQTMRTVNHHRDLALINRLQTDAGNGVRNRGDHDDLFLVFLLRMAANNWDGEWKDNYESPGPNTQPEQLALMHFNQVGIRPTDMALYGKGHQRERTGEEQVWALATNMSPNYKGDPANLWNYSEPSLPDDMNTAFWITHLPGTVTVSDLFDNITCCGPVYAVHINRERVAELGHAGCKLVFKEVQGARAFYERYADNQNLFIGGQQAHIVRNRHKVPEQSGLRKEVTRCILVTGPSHLINMPFLNEFFSALFKFQIDRVIPHWNADYNMSTLEIRFGSYRAQAAVANVVLKRCPIFRDNGVTVRFVPDPCGMPEPLAPGSFTEEL